MITAIFESTSEKLFVLYVLYLPGGHARPHRPADLTNLPNPSLLTEVGLCLLSPSPMFSLPSPTIVDFPTTFISLMKSDSIKLSQCQLTVGARGLGQINKTRS